MADAVTTRQLQPPLPPRLCAARLQRRSSRERPNHVGPPGAENHIDGALESRTEGQQDDHRRNSPSHSEHRQSGAPAVMLPPAANFFFTVIGHKIFLSTFSLGGPRIPPPPPPN